MTQVLIRKEPALGLEGEKEYMYVMVSDDPEAKYFWCVEDDNKKWKIYNTARMGILPDAKTIYGPFYLETQARHHLKDLLGVTL